MTDPNAPKRTRIRRDPTEGVLERLKQMNPDALDKLGADLAKAAPKSARLLADALYIALPQGTASEEMARLGSAYVYPGGAGTGRGQNP